MKKADSFSVGFLLGEIWMQGTFIIENANKRYLWTHCFALFVKKFKTSRENIDYY